MPAKPKPEPMLEFADAAAWGTWLKKHHATAAAVRLRLAKKRTTGLLTYAEALEQALLWGWIDSQKWGLDERSWLQRFTRRGKTSIWSKINCAKAEVLIERGEMKAPGLAEVERAKADGRWQRAYDGARTSTPPADLLAALALRPGALKFFEALDGANRYAILHRVQTAAKPKTRADRIERLADLCARGERLHPRKPVT